MARRNRDLAGLAALGALGLYMARGAKQDGKNVPVEDRGTSARPSVDRPDDRDIGVISGASPSGLYRNQETGDIFSMNQPEAAPVRTPAPARPSSARMPSADEDFPPVKMPRRNVAGDYTRKMGATAEEIEASRNRPAAGGRPASSATNTAKTEEPKAETAKPATRTTSLPAGSLMGRIAGSQGATSNFPEPTDATVGEKSARQRQETMDMFSRMGKKFQRYMGTQETRDRLKAEGYAKGGAVKAKKMASGGSTSSASKRADGIASRGKTKCKMY